MSRLELVGLSKRYGAVTALDAIDLVVPSGSRTAILGPSGCGKTTMLRLVAGFEAPDAGRIVLGSETMAETGSVMPPHRRRIGIVMQDGALFPHLSVGENIAFGLEGRVTRRRERIGALMDLVSLPASMTTRRPDQLSGGQQQRVALARALAREPDLMLLDEPFSALDAGLRTATRDAVAALLANRGITTVLVTHDQGEALGFADQVAVMQGGRIRRAGSPRDVYLQPGYVEVATFLGGAVLLDAEMTEGRAVCALGTLAVDAPARVGRVRLMLRPEQFSVVAPGTTMAVPGRVASATFGGAVATLRVVIDGMREAQSVEVGTRGFTAPSVGQDVGILVEGRAHVLEE